MAAAYATGLCEAWAAEVANLREELRPHTAPGLEASETAPRIHRHATRGQDPDSQREIRERENNTCRAGLRTPQLCTAEGSRPELAATMASVVAFLRRLRLAHPEFQAITRAFGDAPQRPPPPQALVEAARAELLEVLGAAPSAMTDQHPHACWHAGVFKALLLATNDEDLVLADWLLHGAQGGVLNPFHRAPTSPQRRTPQERPSTTSLLQPEIIPHSRTRLASPFPQVGRWPWIPPSGGSHVFFPTAPPRKPPTDLCIQPLWATCGG